MSNDVNKRAVPMWNVVKNIAVPVFAVLAAIFLAKAALAVFFDTPLQYDFNEAGKLNGSSLFFNQKIVYFHVPHAIWLFAAVFVSGTSSIVFLITRRPGWDDLASASTDVAVGFGAVVLLTGSIWGKAAWGVWWQWEPRLTTSLLLWLVLVGYVLVRRFAGAGADRIAAGMAIFGMVTVPFIYVMVGQSSHPASGSNGVIATLPPDMRPTFSLAMYGFLFWYLALVFSRLQTTQAEREIRELRERGLDLGVLQ
jgi:heme exporter protein C